ncbi:MAG: LysM peptidoglycan-binding domain-containing M23 family metallopeptidase [Hyphomonadaceae bacterium]|nr:LysM peptidoglycan-binding domain-containing M23 family metallopeptidase [Hyphomonadaceae bacterium]
MPFALRTLLIASAAGLSACASNPIAPDTAPIDYRGAAPAVKRPAQARVKPKPAPVEAPPPRVVNMGTSPTGTPAIVEAKSLAPENGSRPGGVLRQARDNPKARAIQVMRGDTLYDISRRYSVNMRALIETNKLQPPYALDPGEVVHLPPPNVHVVERGETLYSVSRRYNVDTRSLALLNGLARPWTVWPGDELLLPPLARDDSRRVAVTPVTVAAKSPKAMPPVKTTEPPSLKPAQPKLAVAAPSVAVAAAAVSGDKAISLTGDEPPVIKSEPKSPKPAPNQVVENSSGGSNFIWPVSGTVLRGFGSGGDGQRNDGVNIGVPEGTKVKAAADGEVVYAGDELVGFGNLVLIRHIGGWVSAYAHSESLLVKEGDTVQQGQPIATAGATGNASSPQVHFELRKGKQPVDPAEHLPALKG